MPEVHLELFSGTKSFSKVSSKYPFNCKVISVDIDPSCNPTYVCDILDFHYKELKWVDIITASPPCNTYSHLGINIHKHRNPYTLKPYSKLAHAADKVLYKTIEIIHYFLKKNPNLKFIIENPHGFLWKMRILECIPRVKTYYFLYNSEFYKPTDFFHNLESLILKDKSDRKYMNRRNLSLTRIGYDSSSLYARYKIPPLLVKSLFLQLFRYPSIRINLNLLKINKNIKKTRKRLK